LVTLILVVIDKTNKDKQRNVKKVYG